jgi:pimeloyl-ACP methyl ester carboxylesterase
MAERIVLLHGLWMRPLALAPLARQLRGEGFEVSLYGYPSLSRSADAIVDDLRARIAALRGRTVHVVGHSLGGLIALQALRDERGLPPGRVVCLGSPLLGSRTARAVSAWPLVPWVVGSSGTLLREGVPPWQGAREIGAIAGHAPFGIGVLAGAVRGPGDGTVAVAETRLPGLRDHALVATSHTGLIYSPAVGRMAARFLRHGRFA